MILPRSAFSDALRHVSGIITADLADVYRLTRLFAADGVCYAAGTNGDIMVVTRTPCEGDLPEICVDAGMLSGVVRGAPGESVELEIDGAQVVIRSGRSRFKLGWLNADMPTFNYKDDGEEFEIDGATLSDALRRVKYATAANEPLKAYLEGVHFHNPGSGLRVVAMDGYRLAFSDLGVECDLAVTVPNRTVSAITGIDGPLRCRIGNHGMSVATDDVTIYSKVVADPYAEYQRVVPPGGISMTFNGKELKRAAQRVGMILNEKTRVVRMKMTGSEAIISTLAQTGNEASEEVPCSGGAGLEIGMNIRYLNDALGSFGDCDVEMLTEGEMKPILVREVGGGSVSAVLTPFRL